MIDTNKYEGHTTDWEWKDKEWGVALCGGDSSAGVCGEICCDTPDGKLAQDAPLLLAEVKRLRKRLEAFDCMRFDIEHAIDHSWASWEDLKVFLKEMIE
mgnify:CR=1 FL=1|tara:strand:+ start:157 stop:453 length:297 start_codon:yes stop_codon:yes gene_type:complete